MPFDWDANVSVGYVQEVKFLSCYSRFATRCLKMANPVRSKKHKQSSKTGTNPKKRLPGHSISEEEVESDSDAHDDWDCPFSETEEEVGAMRPEHREMYDGIKKAMNSDHAHNVEHDGILYHWGPSKVNPAFQAAVEHLLPGQGKDFEIEAEPRGGLLGECDEGAKEQMSYLVYRPTFTTAGGRMEHCGRGGINMPWGNRLTPIQAPDAETAKQVDAAFAVLVDRLGLEAIGAPGLKLVTWSSGG